MRAACFGTVELVIVVLSLSDTVEDAPNILSLAALYFSSLSCSVLRSLAFPFSELVDELVSFLGRLRILKDGSNDSSGGKAGEVAEGL